MHWYYFLIFQNYYRYKVYRFYKLQSVSFFKSCPKFKLRNCNQRWDNKSITQEHGNGEGRQEFGSWNAASGP